MQFLPVMICLLLAVAPGVAAAAAVQVRIEGVSGAVLRNVRAHLSIDDLVAVDRDRQPPTDADVRRRHRRAAGDIEQALRALGYYHGSVQSTLERTGDGWVATYRIDRGPPTRWRYINFELVGEVDDDQSFRAALVDLLPDPGTRVHHGLYESAREKVLETLTGAGFLDAAYRRSALLVHTDSQTADLEWTVHSGPRYQFGSVVIDQSVLDPAFVSRYIDLRPGEPFDASRLADLQLRLAASGYFSDVDVEIDRDGAEGRGVPVRLAALPGKSRFYRAGLGYGTDTGPRVTLGTEFRRLNRQGHRLRMDLRAATVRSSAGVEYLMPWRDITRDVARLYGQVDRGDVGDAETDQYSFGLSLEDGWRLGLRRAMYVQFTHESFRFDGEPDRQADLLFAGFRLSQQRGDDLLFTRRGYSASVDVHGGQGDLVSDTSFVHASVRGTAVLPLTAKSRLILRAGLGLVEAEEFSALPPSQRFFTGGDRTLRGYGFETVSAENRTGIDIGGSRFFNQSVEVDTLVWRDFGLAAFFDQGGAGNSFFGTRKQSVGVGFRWRSPVGPLRVDVAHPLDGSGGVRFHLGLGPDL